MSKIIQAAELQAGNAIAASANLSKEMEKLHAAVNRTLASISGQVTALERAEMKQRAYKWALAESTTVLREHAAGVQYSDAAIAKASAQYAVATAAIRKHTAAQFADTAASLTGRRQIAAIGSSVAAMPQSMATFSSVSAGHAGGATLGRDLTFNRGAAAGFSWGAFEEQNAIAAGSTKLKSQQHSAAFMEAFGPNSKAARANAEFFGRMKKNASGYFDVEGKYLGASERGWLSLSGKVGVATLAFFGVRELASMYREIEESAKSIAITNEQIAQSAISLALQDVLTNNPSSLEKVSRMGLPYGVKSSDAFQITQSVLGVEGATEEDVKAAMLMTGQLAMERDTAGEVAAAGALRGKGAAWAALMAADIATLTKAKNIGSISKAFPAQIGFSSLESFGGIVSALSQAGVPDEEMTDAARFATRALRSNEGAFFQKFKLSKDMNEIERLSSIKRQVVASGVKPEDYIGEAFWSQKQYGLEDRQARTMGHLMARTEVAERQFEKFRSWGNLGLRDLESLRNQVQSQSPRIAELAGVNASAALAERTKFFGPVAEYAARKKAERQYIGQQALETMSPGASSWMVDNQGEANLRGRMYYHALESGEPWRAFWETGHKLQQPEDWSQMRAGQVAEVASGGQEMMNAAASFGADVDKFGSIVDKILEATTESRAGSASGAPAFELPVTVPNRNSGS